MPRGDRTGPEGAGPMTGRGLGYCAGYPAPGYTSAEYGLGRGWRWHSEARHAGGRAGRGFRHRYYATGIPGLGRGAYPLPGFAPPTPGAVSDEASLLKAQAERLESALVEIRSRLAALEPDAGE
jgi:hypothetical protein